MKKQFITEVKRLQKLAGIITENELNVDINDYYGEIQAAESELKGALETGAYTEEEYLSELINTSDEELMDFQGGYYDIAITLGELDEEEQQEAITNIKNWAKNQI